jgi:hypothetical protein
MKRGRDVMPLSPTRPSTKRWLLMSRLGRFLAERMTEVGRFAAKRQNKEEEEWATGRKRKQQRRKQKAKKKKEKKKAVPSSGWDGRAKPLAGPSMGPITQDPWKYLHPCMRCIPRNKSRQPGDGSRPLGKCRRRPTAGSVRRRAAPGGGRPRRRGYPDRVHIVRYVRT